MEDSYTVHRRRKAAARRRDKTPEASRAAKEHEIPDEEENNEKLEARARMERMVEDTERMEEMVNDGRRKSPAISSSRTTPENDNQVKKIINEEIVKEEKIQINFKVDIDKQNSVKLDEQTEENCRVKPTMNENRMDFKRVKAKETSRRRERRLQERLSSSDSSLEPQVDKSDKEEIIKREKKPRKQRKEPRNEQPQQFSSSNLTLSNKQIIPLSDDSLFEDLKKAQIEYDRREIGILDVQIDDYVHPKIEAALRKRRKSKIKKEEIKHQDSEDNPVKVAGGWSTVFTWLWSLVVRKKDSTIEETKLIEEEIIIEETKVIKEEIKIEEKKIIKEELPLKPEKQPKKPSKFFEFLRILSDVKAELKAFAERNPREIYLLRKSRNRCIAQLILIIIYCGLGAFIFRFVEGAFEAFYKCGVKRVKRDFLDSLWNYSHNMREDDWKSMARRKLMEFEEQLHAAHEAGVHSYSGQKSWSFLNAVVYSLTVITTIGYGHISPSTTTGRAVTIIYAIFGIPLFLIILADFGKLFTRGIKFLWAFVRRVYYTGSCRRVRRTVPVQEVMKGVQLVYDLATFRRPSQMNPEELEEMRMQQGQTVLNLDGNLPPIQPDTPATPAMSNFAIDDEFNLPISVAITILVIYIFVGATAYNLWERWGFFESFYFVFISMSTIGFGDYVPKHPIYMMCSIVYLVFGLALTSMCINVVQTMLSDSFKHATQKIGATIGFEVAEDDGSIQAVAPQSVEVAEVHATIAEEDEPKINEAPKTQNNHEEL